MQRPLCKCGNLCKTNGFSRVTGEQLYNTYCRTCAKTKHGKKERINRTFKKDLCSFCGFKATHPCQLDLDHIDGNSKNNDPSNHQTLCANCHRLKTFLNKDWDSS